MEVRLALKANVKLSQYSQLPIKKLSRVIVNTLQKIAIIIECHFYLETERH